VDIPICKRRWPGVTVFAALSLSLKKGYHFCLARSTNQLDFREFLGQLLDKLAKNKKAKKLTIVTDNVSDLFHTLNLKKWTFLFAKSFMCLVVTLDLSADVFMAD
jgi:hypothetical protein